MEDPIYLRNYLLVLRRHWWLILVGFLAATGAMAIRSLRAPDVYAATTAVMPPPDLRRGLSDLGNVLGTGKAALLGRARVGTDVTDIYTGILESQAVAGEIVDHFGLREIYGLQRHAQAVSALRRNTSIAVSEAGILRVTVRDVDPNRAARLANAYVEELERQNARLSASQATSERLFLEGRLREVEEELQKIDRLPSHEVMIKEMLFEMLMREYELAKMDEAGGLPTVQVLDEASPPEVRMPRGTVRKVSLAGIASVVLCLLGAFVREYYAE